MRLLPIAILFFTLNLELFLSNNLNNTALLTPFGCIMISSILAIYSFSDNSMIKLCFINAIAKYLIYLALFFVNNRMLKFNYFLITNFNIFALGWSIACYKNQEVQKVTQSYFFSTVFKELLKPIYFVYVIFWYTKMFLYSSNYTNFNSILLSAFVIFTQIMAFKIVLDLYDILTDKNTFNIPVINKGGFKGKYSKIKSLISSLIPHYLFFLIAIILYYLNYNEEISNYLYHLLMTKVSQPNNIFIYNSIPLNQDTRYKMILFISIFVYNRINELIANK